MTDPLKSRPVIMAIVGEGGARAAGEAIRGGADLIQVRAKSLSDAALLRLAREVIAELDGRSERLVINSRPDVAALVKAWGVHLPEAGLGVQAVRDCFPTLQIGVSRHDRAGLERAVQEGVGYALMGPVFETPGKEKRILGLAAFEEAVREVHIPVLAVGGISEEEIPALAKAGAAGVAAIRPFLREANARAQGLRWRLAWTGRGP